MNTQALLLLIELFLQPAYSVEDAVARIGPIIHGVVPGQVQRVGEINLRPHDARICAARLKYRASDGALSSILLDLSEPQRIDFDQLRALYGAPTEEPRLHPRQPIPYCFTAMGHPLWGSVVLSISTPNPEGVREVNRIFLLRMSHEEAL